MIDLIPYKKPTESLSLKQLALPLDSPLSLRESSLAYHVVDDEDHAHGIVSKWKDASACTDIVPITSSFRQKDASVMGKLSTIFSKSMIANELLQIDSDAKKKNARKRVAKKKNTKKKSVKKTPTIDKA